MLHNITIFKFSLKLEIGKFQRRTFLEDALRSLTVDVAKVLVDAVKVLSDAEKMNSIQLGQELPDDVAAAFFNIQEFISDIDVANGRY